MPSEITQVIGAAASQTVQNTQAATTQRQPNQSQVQAQVSQASQTEARRATVNPKVDERKRSPQVPKRAEGIYGIEEEKEKTAEDSKDAPATQTVASKSKDKDLDVLA